MRIYYRKNTQVIEVSELADHEGVQVSGATVKATITCDDGSDVPGITNPISLNDEGAGKYSGVVPSIELEDGENVIVEVNAQYNSIEATSRERFVVKNRGF